MSKFFLAYSVHPSNYPGSTGAGPWHTPVPWPGDFHGLYGHGVTKSRIRQRLSFQFTNKLIYKIETDLWISKTSL